MKGKSVWRHNLVMVLLRYGNLRLPFACRLYTKDGKSRIDLAKELIEHVSAIRRFLLLLLLTYLYCEQTGYYHVSHGLSFLWSERQQQLIEWIYDQGQQGCPLSEVKRLLCAA